MMKTLLDSLFDYAVEYELTNQNYSRMIKVTKVNKTVKETRKNHIAFSKDELEVLWKNIKDQDVQLILFQCYSGWRPSELIKLKLSDVDLENMQITGGMKTSAGKNRTVPIHPLFMRFIKEKYNEAKDEGRESLFSLRTYDQVRSMYIRVIKKYKLDSNHKPHDGRKTFVTLAKKYGMDEYAIKRIVGHTITDITEQIYTERDADWLHSEMQKIRA